MTRLRFLLALLDRRDRVVIAGALCVVILTSYGVGSVTTAHRMREARYADCVKKIRDEDQRHRERGLVTIRFQEPCAR